MTDELGFGYYEWDLIKSDKVEKKALAPEFPPQEADWFDKVWFNEDSNEYTIQWKENPEDPAFIVLEILKRMKFPVEIIAFLRYNKAIAEIWNMKLNTWDKIILLEWWPNEFELQIWNQYYVINTVQNKIIKVSE
jgi:hypothetical protein